MGFIDCLIYFLSFLYVYIDDINIIRGGRLFESITEILYFKLYTIENHRFTCDFKPFDSLDIPAPNWLQNEVVELNKHIPEFKIINGYRYRLWSKVEKEESTKPEEVFHKF